MQAGAGSSPPGLPARSSSWFCLLLTTPKPRGQVTSTTGASVSPLYNREANASSPVCGD